jgi:hypothetical protein
MRTTTHILVVNGTKVRRPVFVLGSPQSGTDLLAHALDRAGGFQLTSGHPGLIRVAYAFARRPSIAADAEQGAAQVLRDACAQAWLEARPRADGGRRAVGATGTIERFGDATPDLLYSADALLDAFPDAQLLQIIRDGRDVVAAMLADPAGLGWLKPGFMNLDEVFPNPFLGVSEAADRSRWPDAAAAVKCAMRWRGSVRLSARLRAQTPDEQLLTVRYEDLITRPRAVADRLSDYLGTRVPRTPPGTDGHIGMWRERLTARQAAQVEKVAGAELRRLGYLRAPTAQRAIRG